MMMIIIIVMNFDEGNLQDTVFLFAALDRFLPTGSVESLKEKPIIERKQEIIIDFNAFFSLHRDIDVSVGKKAKARETSLHFLSNHQSHWKQQQSSSRCGWT